MLYIRLLELFKFCMTGILYPLKSNSPFPPPSLPASMTSTSLDTLHKWNHSKLSFVLISLQIMSSKFTMS